MTWSIIAMQCSPQGNGYVHFCFFSSRVRALGPWTVERVTQKCVREMKQWALLYTVISYMMGTVREKANQTSRQSRRSVWGRSTIASFNNNSPVIESTERRRKRRINKSWVGVSGESSAHVMCLVSFNKLIWSLFLLSTGLVTMHKSKTSGTRYTRCIRCVMWMSKWIWWWWWWLLTSINDKEEDNLSPLVNNFSLVHFERVIAPAINTCVIERRKGWGGEGRRDEQNILLHVSH